MKILYFVVTFMLIIANYGTLSSVENDDCMMCHSDPDMYMEKGRSKISLWVDNSKFIFSVHKNVKCVDCHKGFDPDDIPHKKNIGKIDCNSCHQGVEKKHTFHPWMADAPLQNDCKKCHGYHYATPAKGKGSKVSGIHSLNQCGTCHQDVVDEYMKSEHYKALLNISDENAPDCNYCHRKPITKGWIGNYIQRKANQNQVCTDCHSHDTKNPSVIKTITNSNSRHFQLKTEGKEHAAVCTDCHGFHNIKKNEDFEARLSVKNSFSACGKCHVHIAQEYQNSIHGLAQIIGNMDAASCVSCHFEHDLKKVPHVDEAIFKSNKLNKKFAIDSKMIYCVSCHGDSDLMGKSKLKSLVESHSWLPELESHFAAVSCFDCHSSYTVPYLSHNILPLEKSVKTCNPCHEQDMNLKTKLANYYKTSKTGESGIIDGTISGGSYIGLSRSVILDYLSFILLGGVFIGLLAHGYIRWYFRSKKESK
ncbi:MAG: cytochrome c3 family protein [Desulfobulbaceae bacterium]|nr:cytochrome c3 family protein [Desulfobulbaceae bacterium]